MRIVNDYVMDHMDDLSKHIANLKEVMDMLLEDLRFRHSEFAARCKFRSSIVTMEDICIHPPGQRKCTIEDCPHVMYKEGSGDGD